MIASAFSDTTYGPRQLCQAIVSEVKPLQVGELADLNREFRDSFSVTDEHGRH
jgi:hypothetical protein